MSDDFLLQSDYRGNQTPLTTFDKALCAFDQTLVVTWEIDVDDLKDDLVLDLVSYSPPTSC